MLLKKKMEFESHVVLKRRGNPNMFGFVEQEDEIQINIFQFYVEKKKFKSTPLNK